MIKIKKFISFLFSFIVILVIFFYRNDLLNKLDDIFDANRDVIIRPGNGYQKKDTFIFLKQSDDYIPYNYNDLVNIFYSVLNQGWDEFTFYCPIEYDECLDDVYSLSHDDVLLSEINNYVHPYNNYSTIKTLYDDTGEVTLKVSYLYTDEEIKRIDNEIDEIIAQNILSEMNDRDKIKVLHDYIITNTTYDKVREETKDSQYDSSRMTGLLFEHYSVCSGYTDVMAVMLEKLNIRNFRVASEEHIWNAVYIDDEWKHLDLTWDDPVSPNGKEVLEDTFFLIDTETLLDLDEKEKEHIFNIEFYLEFKE